MIVLYRTKPVQNKVQSVGQSCIGYL